MPNILILVTGSVAAIKLPLLIDRLQQMTSSEETTAGDVTTTTSSSSSIKSSKAVNIRVVVTEASLHFFSLEEVQAKLNKSSPSSSSITEKCVLRDADEWSAWRVIGDPVLHIELRNWAHLGLIAPLDANTLGKIAAGQCDNLLTCVLRAWDQTKPLLFAPAMNVHMWAHPLTERSLGTLTTLLGYHQIGPISKRLACGDLGMGAMAEVEQIAEEVRRHLITQANLI